jgi:outer membrane receptor protein involved in Fe transport
MVKKMMSTQCSSRKYFTLLTRISSLGLFAYSTALYAQEPLEEVMVTATKRGATSIQETPVSISAITGNSLKQQGATDISDYYREVPGLSIQDHGSGSKMYILRGITSVGAGTVGLYLDEVIITDENIQGSGGREPDIKLFDMNRVEVLRGPQGTVFGSSTLAGVIRWIPNAPDYSEYVADVNVGAGITKESKDTNWQTEGMINVPIVQDKLAFRLSGTAIHKAGYIDQRLKEDANYNDTNSARGILAWRISDNTELSVMGMFQQVDALSRPYYNKEDLDLNFSPTLNGGPLPGKYYSYNLTLGGSEDESHIYNAKLVHQTNWGAITATTSIFERDLEIATPASHAWETLSGGLYPAESTGNGIIANNKERTLFTNEVRFASSWNGPLQLLVGAFTQREERELHVQGYSVPLETGRIAPSSVTFLERRVWTEVDEKAVFGELSWNVTDRLNVTGGARWFDFDVKEHSASIIAFPGNPGPGLAPQFSFAEDDVIFKSSVSYKFTDDLLGYTTVSEGYRSGGANNMTAAELYGVDIPLGYGSDSLVNYEAGIKSAWLDERLVLNGAAFYIDWTNIQTQQSARSPDGLVIAYRGNGGAAESYGGEFEVVYRPNDHWDLGLALSYTHSALAEDMPLPNQGRKGDKLEFVPEYSANLSVSYERPLRDELTGFIGGNVSYQDDQVTRRRPEDPNYRTIEAHSLANMRMGIRGSDWSVVLNVANLLDDNSTIMYGADTVGPQPGGVIIPDQYFRLWPRTVSLSYRKSFTF